MLATVHTGMINYFYPGVFLGAKLFDVKNLADCFRSQVPYGFRCLAWLSTLKHGMFFPNCVQILREGQEQIDNSIRTLLCGVPP